MRIPEISLVRRKRIIDLMIAEIQQRELGPRHAEKTASCKGSEIEMSEKQG